MKLILFILIAATILIVGCKKANRTNTPRDSIIVMPYPIVVVYHSFNIDSTKNQLNNTIHI
jgi:hypothetical protein